MLWTVYGPTLTLWAGLAFINLFAACYAVSRTVFLKDTGQKLASRKATAQRVAVSRRNSRSGWRSDVMGRDWSPDDREPESSGPSRPVGSTPPRRATTTARHAARRDSRRPDDERFLVVRWHERIVTVSPSGQGTLRTLGAIAPSRHRIRDASLRRRSRAV